MLPPIIENKISPICTFELLVYLNKSLFINILGFRRSKYPSNKVFTCNKRITTGYILWSIMRTISYI